MKKLICSLMVVTMLFSMVSASFAEANSINKRKFEENVYEEDVFEEDEFEEDEFEFEEDEYGRPVFATINLARIRRNNNGNKIQVAKELYQNYMKFLINKGINETNAIFVILDIYHYREEMGEFISEIVLVEIVFYLIKNGVSILRNCTLREYVLFSVPENLSKDQGRMKAIREIVKFCKRFGTICVLSTGDAIDADGIIHTLNTDDISYYCSEDYWIDNTRRFKITGNVLHNDADNFYGFFILPDGRAFNCHLKEYSDFMDLKEIKSIVDKKTGEERLTISEDGVVTLKKEDVKIRPIYNKEEIGEDVIKVLKNGLALVIFDLVRYGVPIDYFKYMMYYLWEIDQEVKNKIYGSENNLLKFVKENYCKSSLWIAMETMENMYIHNSN